MRHWKLCKRVSHLGRHPVSLWWFQQTLFSLPVSWKKEKITIKTNYHLISQIGFIVFMFMNSHNKYIGYILGAIKEVSVLSTTDYKQADKLYTNTLHWQSTSHLMDQGISSVGDVERKENRDHTRLVHRLLTNAKHDFTFWIEETKKICYIFNGFSKVVWHSDCKGINAT